MLENCNGTDIENYLKIWASLPRLCSALFGSPPIIMLRRRLGVAKQATPARNVSGSTGGTDSSLAQARPRGLSRRQGRVMLRFPHSAGLVERGTERPPATALRLPRATAFRDRALRARLAAPEQHGGLGHRQGHRQGVQQRSPRPMAPPRRHTRRHPAAHPAPKPSNKFDRFACTLSLPTLPGVLDTAVARRKINRFVVKAASHGCAEIKARGGKGRNFLPRQVVNNNLKKKKTDKIGTYRTIRHALISISGQIHTF